MAGHPAALIRCRVGWEGGSVPTIRPSTLSDGGHASAPLPTLRLLEYLISISRVRALSLQPLGRRPQASVSLAFEAALMKTRIKWLLPVLFAALLLAATQPAHAAGVTDTEIRIGNIM